MELKQKNRFLELEGLRGLAAFVVFLFHFLVLYYPVMYFGQSLIQHSWLEDNIHGTPLVAFISGTFSVAIFFVLSGFVLSIGFFQTKSLAIIRKIATKRYLRLMLPALASIILVLVLLKLQTSQLSVLYSVTRSGAIPGPWVVNPNLLQAVHEGVAGIFIDKPIHNYNSVLWTMKYEFIGSFIIFASLALFGKSSKRWLVYLLLVMGLYNTWYIGLILGMVLADFYVHKGTILQRIHSSYFYVLLVIGVVFGAYPTERSAMTIYHLVTLPWLTADGNLAIYTTLGAVCVVLAVLNIKLINSIMSSKIMSKMGGYTYSLYLVHQPLVYTVGAGWFLLLIHYMGYNRSVLVSMVLTIPVIIIATLLFHRYVEVPSIRLASYFEEVYSGKRDMELYSKVRSTVSHATELFTKMFRNVSYQLSRAKMDNESE